MIDKETAVNCARSKQVQVERAVSPLLLFIWTNFCPDYTSGLAFAIAKNETDARKQITKEYGFVPYDWGTLEVRKLNKRVARCVSGGG